MMAPKASIIIVTYGQRPLTEQCLRSLERCLGDRLGTEWELVLVDNDSPDDTAELLRAWSDRAVVKLLPENRNFAGGCNIGAAAAGGEVLVFLNNDTEVTPGALDVLAEQSLEPGVSAAGCRLLFPDGTLQHAGVAFLHGQALGGAAMGQHIFHHHSPELPAGYGTYEMDCVTAACMAVRASTFRALGGFDETFLNGLEDVDLCLRIRMAGESIVYRGDITIVHHEGASRGQGAQLWATPQRLAAMRHNDLHFVSRWGQHLDQDDELAARLWDATLEDQPPARAPSSFGDIVVAGQPAGLGPGADEARALIGALTAVGRVPVAIDHPRLNVRARLSAGGEALVAAARRRVPGPAAPCLLVPAGAHDALQVNGAPSIVRLGRSRTASPLDAVTEVWAASPTVAAALVSAGLPAARVRVVLPPVMTAAAGPGGHGVLAVLPAHDASQARALLAALRRLPRSTPLRLVPTVFTRGLASQVAEAVPGAELLGPVADETRFAALAATADVVVAADDLDPFERRALIAAGVGAAIVNARPDGPAAAVLGDEVARTADGAERTVAACLERAHDRQQRAAAVADVCGPERLADHLRDTFPALSAAA